MECEYKILVLIHKGNGEFRGIRIMEVIKKAVLGVVNCKIGVEVDFNNTLHGSRSGRRMEISYPEVKLLRKLEAMEKEVFYEVLLDP